MGKAREAIALLCEPVQPPKNELDHIHYFCGNTEIPGDLADHKPQRVGLYKATAELDKAGYNQHEIGRIEHAHQKISLVGFGSCYPPIQHFVTGYGREDAVELIAQRRQLLWRNALSTIAPGAC